MVPFELLRCFYMVHISPSGRPRSYDVLGLCKMMAVNLAVLRQIERLNLGYFVMLSLERTVIAIWVHVTVSAVSTARR